MVHSQPWCPLVLLLVTAKHETSDSCRINNHDTNLKSNACKAFLFEPYILTKEKVTAVKLTVFTTKSEVTC